MQTKLPEKVIYVNKYPEGEMYAHSTAEVAKQAPGYSGTTHAYMRLPEGVSPETHEPVKCWVVYKSNGNIWGVFTKAENAAADTKDIGGYVVETIGWNPKPKREPESEAWLPEPGDWFEWASHDSDKWQGRGRCTEVVDHSPGVYWVWGTHIRYPGYPNYTWSSADRKFRPAEPPEPWVPEPGERFMYEGEMFQRDGVDEPRLLFAAWSFTQATTRNFDIGLIQLGHLVLEPVDWTVKHE